MFVLPLAYPLPRRAFRPARACSLPQSGGETAPLRPAMDASESDAAYTLSFDLPGLTREQVNVTIVGQEVSIEAAAAEAAAPEGVRVLRRERRAPSCRWRSMPMRRRPALPTAC
jgi:HSP20 family molecular chaperone IbpA